MNAPDDSALDDSPATVDTGSPDELRALLALASHVAACEGAMRSAQYLVRERLRTPDEHGDAFRRWLTYRRRIEDTAGNLRGALDALALRGDARRPRG